jgi:hypothetical protein
MDDVLYRGWRIWVLAWAIASGGFRSGALIWFDAGTSGRRRPITLRGSWNSEEEARRHALDVAQRVIDARLATGGFGGSSESSR